MISLHTALRSSRAAIDLASIMVGIIIIGLIGGVIAATVFAVIPWSQDKAAKQQLDSVHTAQNAFFGLSSDPSQDLTNGKKNSFADSTELQAANLLSTAVNYCTIASADGKNYQAYAKSSSGKWFTASNNNKTAKEASRTNLCDSSVTPAPDTGDATPAAPVFTGVRTYSFEEYKNGDLTSWNGINASKVPTAIYNAAAGNTQAYKGTMGQLVQGQASATSFGMTKTESGFVVGKTYKVSAWISANSAVQTISGSVSGNGVVVATSPTVSNTRSWMEISTEFVATSPTMDISFVGTKAVGSATNVTIYSDEITISQRSN
jgi:type II secretory pathway pseudopilin PulG